MNGPRFEISQPELMLFGISYRYSFQSISIPPAYWSESEKHKDPRNQDPEEGFGSEEGLEIIS